jgi:hypothetical protein
LVSVYHNHSFFTDFFQFMKIFPNKEVSLGTEDRNIIIRWSQEDCARKCVIVGLNYQPCDRREINKIIDALPKEINIHYINRSPKNARASCVWGG